MRNKLIYSLAVAVFSFAASGLGFAADMAVKMPVKAPPPPPPAPIYNWTGFYAGLNAGWSWGQQDTTVNFPGQLPSPITAVLPPPLSGASTFFPPSSFAASIETQETNKLNGAIGGVQVGYNWQGMSNWILGFETDFQGSGEHTNGSTHQNVGQGFEFQLIFPTVTTGATITSTQSISHDDSLLWFGTVRGRVGYAIWPNLMLYGTGGLAYGRLKESVSASSSLGVVTTGTPPSLSATFPNGTTVPLPFSASQNFDASVTRIGWTVGGGMEGAVPNTHVTWKVEYLYMDLGTENFSFSNPLLGTILVNTHFTDNIVRGGVNYHF